MRECPKKEKKKTKLKFDGLVNEHNGGLTQGVNEYYNSLQVESIVPLLMQSFPSLCSRYPALQLHV